MATTTPSNENLPSSKEIPPISSSQLERKGASYLHGSSRMVQLRQVGGLTTVTLANATPTLTEFLVPVGTRNFSRSHIEGIITPDQQGAGLFNRMHADTICMINRIDCINAETNAVLASVEY